MDEHVKMRKNKGESCEKSMRTIRRNDSIIGESFTNRTNYSRCNRSLETKQAQLQTEP